MEDSPKVVSRASALEENEPLAQQPGTTTQQGHPAQPSKKHSQIWQNAIRRYYDELGKGGIRGPAIDKDLWDIKSPEELLDLIKDLVPPDSRSSRAWVGSLRRLETVLLSLNDFAAVTAWALGMNGRVAALVWGSIRLILNLAQPVLPEVLEMLEELRRTLPRYKVYEHELHMTGTLEDALSDMYTEIIVFCARAITFFRNNPNIARSRNAWSEFNGEFLKTVGNLRNYSRRVDEEADMIRMTRETRSAETIDVMRKLNVIKLGGGDVKLPCHMIPFGLNLRFFGRAKEVAKVKEILDPKEGGDKLRVMAIHGLGGVGKTQLALHYANTSLKLYDVIAWIPSETQIKMTQSLSAFAQKLGLPLGSEAEDDYQSSLKVRDWLNNSGRRFLLIFDNVDTIDVLSQVWPASDKGSILITTRSLSMASKRTTDIMRLESFTSETGLEALYSLTGIRPADDHDSAAAAKDICHLLGGLPLAMVQISEFIRDRSYSYEEFLARYRSSAAKILAKGETPIEYNLTLSTVWDLSLQRLPQEAKILQNLVTFFDPDRIEERLLTNPKACLSDDRLDFLMDEFDFGEAVSALVKSSLVNRSSACKTFSVHRLVQSAVFSRLSNNEVMFFLDSAIRLLSNGFPNMWKKTGHQQGHGWASWETCSEVLPHVSWLMELAKKYNLKPSDPELFAELIFRSGTYLWEREQPTTARSFFIYGLSLDVDREGPTCNPAVRLLGHVALDMAQPKAALEAYCKTLTAQLKLVEPDSPEIANIYDSIACSYTEMDNVGKAFEYLDKAMKIHNAKGPSGKARTCAILAMTHLRARNPDQALEALKECWRLQNLTEEQIAESRYPKHSGDIVLLSRIQYAQGNKDSALELASKSINIRKGILGNKGPRVADSMYIVAGMLRDNQKEALAAKLLREVVDMSCGVMNMEGHLARAMWMLGRLEEEAGNLDGAEELKRKARAVRGGIEGREGEGEDEDTDEGFGRLVGYMLW